MKQILLNGENKNSKKNIHKKYSLGVDIGGTKCAIVLGKSGIVNDSGEDFIIERICFQTLVKEGCQNTIINIIEAIKKIMENHNIKATDILGIGISCGGPLDYKKGIIINPPNLIGWDHVPIVDILFKQFGIPTYLQNDANAGALAEWTFGAGKGTKNMIFLTFGTGLGAGLILEGRLYHGFNDMAGEVGHIRLERFGPVGYGKAGSFEGFCSGGGITQIANMKIQEQMQLGIIPKIYERVETLSQIDSKLIAEMAMEGDAFSKEIFEICGTYLGKGLSILIDILNPEMIVLGSIFQRNEELLRKNMLDSIEREALTRSYKNCRILPAKLGEQIGDYAALSVALQANSL